MPAAAQLVLILNEPTKSHTPLWREPLVLPSYLAATSILLFVLQLAWKLNAAKTLILERVPYGVLESGRKASKARFRKIAKEQVTTTVFLLGILRLLSCLALLTISIISFVEYKEDVPTDPFFESQEKHGNKKNHRKTHQKTSIYHEEWIEITLCAFYTYTSLLALLHLTVSPWLRRMLNTHLSLLLLGALGIYVQRDVWPLATFSIEPIDGVSAWKTWSRIGILGFSSILIPLLVPREYIPIDITNPNDPVPEQTASPLSFMTFSFVDSLIWEAHKTPHLAYEKLPPLADYDRGTYLRATAFPNIDPMLQSKPLHIAWGLLRYYRYEYSILMISLAGRILFAYASPVAVNNLLQYIETNGEDAYIRPWVWISTLFFSPFITSIVTQFYVFFTNRMRVLVEGILAQLIFEHALRMRVKEETGDDQPTGDPSSVQPTKTGRENSKKSHLIGRVNTLLGQDINNVFTLLDVSHLILGAPLQLILSTWLLYTLLGWSAFVGMAVMAACFPLPGKISLIIKKAQKEQMTRTDGRVQTVVEIMSVIRMVKMFGWENKVSNQLKARRQEELYWIKRRLLFGLLSTIVNWILPLLVMITTFSCYTLVMHQSLTASTVSPSLIFYTHTAWIFTSITVFDTLKNEMTRIFSMIPSTTQAIVSLDRINDFLYTTELLDRYTTEGRISSQFTTPSATPDAIGFHNATFTWSKSEADYSAPSTPSRRNFRLDVDGDVFFKHNAINLIVGPTGSGKTSLLLALLGELHFTPREPDAWFNLPKDKGVAYAAQEPWIQNETIRDNIVFGADYDAQRYRKVLYQCALEQDLDLFTAGDNTEVGEKGLTLSGGQKARVSLARAVYSSADIILLDDVLSALDVHTARWIVDECLTGDLLRGRTVILVTHNLAMAGPIAQHIVSISSNGTITSQNSIRDAFLENQDLRSETEKQNEIIAKVDASVDGVAEAPKQANPLNGKLIAEEEVALGHLNWEAVKLYISSSGGMLFLVVYLATSLISAAFSIIQAWFLGHWATQYDEHLPEEINVPYYIGVYGLLIIAGTLCYMTNYGVFVYGSLRASQQIHEMLMNAILGAPLRFLDKTPVGRIIARFTQDMRSIDSVLPRSLNTTIELSSSLLTKFVTIVVLTPVFLPPSLAFAIIGGWLGRIYIAAQLPVKREMSNARSPLFSHFGASIHGLTSIRAYGAEDKFKDEALRRVDKYTRTARSYFILNRWIAVRADGLGACFTAGLAAYLVYARDASDASNTGLQLNLAVGFTSVLIWWVRNLNDLEVEGNSLERIEHYIDIEQEPKPVSSKKPPAAWPASGSLRVDHLSARYSQDGPNVLHNLSFEIKSGEKVGVVGRTGSGKSSLTLSLLRLIPQDGKVIFDGIPTSELNLEDLRWNITMIPQAPELLSGTIRQNLDPLGQHEDAVLNDALRAAGLFSLQSDLPQEERITLDSSVGSGGGNFSIGQRQILALARALVRQSKVLILDEATASLDHKTDTLVQQSLKNEFQDSTLITIAHRLQTIMNSDKILVLDAGKLIEFDSPLNLLRKDGGAFKRLVDESGDKEALYALARGEN